MPGDYEDGGRFGDSYYEPLNQEPAGRNYSRQTYNGYGAADARAAVYDPVTSRLTSYGAGAGPYDYTTLGALRGPEAPYYFDRALPSAAAPRTAGAYDRDYVAGSDRDYAKPGQFIGPQTAPTLAAAAERMTSDFAGVFDGRPLSSDSVLLLFIIIVALVATICIQNYCHGQERGRLLETLERSMGFKTAMAST